MAVAGEYLAFAMDVALAVRNFDGDSTCEGHVALEVEETLTG